MPKHLPHGRAHLNRVFSSYEFNARRRGIEFLLTKEQFEEMIKKPCFYCGARPKPRPNKSAKSHMAMNGVDRVNNAVGYIASNCVAACLECNMAKRTLSFHTFLKLAKRIYEHHKAYFVGL